MKIRMLVQVSGTRNGLDWPARGSVVDLPDDEAQSYVDNGMADKLTNVKLNDSGPLVRDRVTDAPQTDTAGPQDPDILAESVEDEIKGAEAIDAANEERAAGDGNVEVADSVETEEAVETATGPDEKPTPAAIREWAAKNKVEVSDRGPIPADVLERYLADTK